MKSICVCVGKFKHGIVCFVVVLNELFILNCYLSDAICRQKPDYFNPIS